MNSRTPWFAGLAITVRLCGMRFSYKAIQNRTNGGPRHRTTKLRFAEREHTMRQHEKSMRRLSNFDIGRYLGVFSCRLDRRTEPTLNMTEMAGNRRVNIRIAPGQFDN